jgi:uncharacterized damage-inducible protein DinB
MLAHLRMFASYNTWANALVYDHAAKLSDADYRADRGAFFKSIYGTLNHLLVTDRIWMQRFTGEGETTQKLDAILHESFDDLRAARVMEDARISGFIDGLDEEQLTRTISYRAISKPAQVEQRLDAALAHFFNHQTHHRGQVHCLLTSLTGDGPVLDLAAYQRQIGLSQTRFFA